MAQAIQETQQSLEPLHDLSSAPPQSTPVSTVAIAALPPRPPHLEAKLPPIPSRATKKSLAQAGTEAAASAWREACQNCSAATGPRAAPVTR